MSPLTRPTIRLGVNIDHIATLREVRKAKYPDILEAMKACERGGADQITVHLREDRRHIQDRDVELLIRESKLPVNLEMAFVDEMLTKALNLKPYSVTLVPERRAEMTTESGLDLARIEKGRAQIDELLESGIRVHGFIDPDLNQVKMAEALRLTGVEFHTGTFAEAFEKAKIENSSAAQGALELEVKRLIEAAEKASSTLEVKAGHGLTLENVRLLFQMKNLNELNIGHSIVARAIFLGLEAAVREMKMALALSLK